MAGLGYTLAGVAALFALARRIECRHTPAPPFRRADLKSRLARLASVGGACLLLAAASARADECPAASAFNPKSAKLVTLDEHSNRMLEILAIGSSSTEGIGASSPSHAYPAVLADELAREDRIAADVRNAGVGGELAANTLLRLKAALKTGWPELVIWQVGTNDALVGVDETAFRATVESGIAAAQTARVPLVLVGPQFTLRTPDSARYERFVAIVNEIGERLSVPVLSRYAMMKQSGAKKAVALLSGDGLHMNDLGYRCLAHALAEEIESAAREVPRPAAKL